MSDGTAIEWTDATWNPITGCSAVSPGCTNCYAMRLAGTRLREHATRKGLTRDTKAGPVWTGDVRFNALALTEPLRWKKPRMIFVCAHGDLFHDNVPDEWIDRIFAVMALCPQHTFQVLTKRSSRMRRYMQCNHDETIFERWHAIEKAARAITGGPLPDGTFPNFRSIPLPNVWMGISAEDQTRLDQRWPDLAATHAAVRWISAEPLLGPLDFLLRGETMGDWDSLRGREYWAGASAYADSINALKSTHPKIDWIVVGGESGPHARPMHPQWARDIRDQCAAAGVPFFFKQWGEYLPVGQILPDHGKVHGATSVQAGRMKLHYGGTPTQLPKHAFAERGVEVASMDDNRLTFMVGKKAAGRLLDGVTHDAMPAAR